MCASSLTHLLSRMGERASYAVSRYAVSRRIGAMDFWAIRPSTVGKYLRRTHKPPSQTWRTFLTNQRTQMASMDFFTVPTAALRVLLAFLVLSHDRRRTLHWNITRWSGLNTSQVSSLGHLHATWQTAQRALCRQCHSQPITTVATSPRLRCSRDRLRKQ
jgi:hypothetical protein